MSAMQWKACNADGEGCSCGLVWDVAADDTVARVFWKTEDGEWSKTQFAAHYKLIAAAPALAAALADFVATHGDCRCDECAAANKALRAAGRLP